MEGNDDTSCMDISANGLVTGAINVKVTTIGDDDDGGMWMKPSDELDNGSNSESEEDIRSATDPWSVQLSSDLDTPAIKWQDLNTNRRVKRVAKYILKPIGLVLFLYLFVCSLDLLCSAFRLLGSKTAGQVFSSSEIMQNPIAGLMIGILCTVLVQSSSTSTSVVVSMVGSGILDVRMAIPIIMGANIGTSITNTLVSLAHSTQKDEFRRAFAGATVHDMFNWLTVIVLLPLEVITGYLYYTTGAIVRAFNLHTNSSHNQDFLAAIVKPLTGFVVSLDKDMLTKIALGDKEAMSGSLVKRWCAYDTVNASDVWNSTELIARNLSSTSTVEQPKQKCDSLFALLPLGDAAAGAILLVASLAMLIACLVCLSKLLGSMLRGRLASLIKKTLNADFPGKLSFLTGYLAIVVGMGLTILVQSSSVFTSALTPLVGIGALTVERMYPLTLGSNIGTTTTGMLAAMACSGNCAHSLQIALCHLFFNLSGILLFFPVPAMRWPIGLSKMLGNTTARFRWFAIFYVIAMFFVAPAVVFGLSMVGPVLCFAVVGSFFVLVAAIVVVNTIQRKRPTWLPKCLRTWDFLPLWMHSLEPLDRALTQFYACFAAYCCCCCCCCKKADARVARVQQEYKSRVSTATTERHVRPTAVTAFRSPMFKGNSRFHDVPSEASIMPLMTISPKPSSADLVESGYVSSTVTPSASLAGSHLRIPTLQ